MKNTESKKRRHDISSSKSSPEIGKSSRQLSVFVEITQIEYRLDAEGLAETSISQTIWSRSTYIWNETPSL